MRCPTAIVEQALSQFYEAMDPSHFSELIEDYVLGNLEAPEHGLVQNIASMFPVWSLAIEAKRKELISAGNHPESR